MIGAALVAGWGASRGLDAGLVGAIPSTRREDQDIAAPWGVADRLDRDNVAPWGVADRLDRDNEVRWGRYDLLDARASVPWGVATPIDRAGVSPWGTFSVHLSRPLWADWGIATVSDRAVTSPWGQYTARIDAETLVSFSTAMPVDPLTIVPWGRYTQPIGISIDVPTETGEGAAIIPVQRTYIVINDISLIRVSDSLLLPAISLSLSIDADSWVWGFSASLPGSALDDVIGDPGEPVELAANINGFSFRVLAESVSRDRRHAASRITLSGRGIAAVLDAPYAPLANLYSADAITAQQAAEDAITLATLPTGWTLDWQLTDWLLPAGLWAHQGSPLSAVTRIAQAAGGYVQADAVNQVLHILPRYALAPWDWPSATADIEIPADVATTEGIAWSDKPVYNAVYISGSAGGVLGHVKRTGTAGDIVAQMITDDLITHADAARQRGLPILSDTGRQADISLSMPILAAGGIILPGTLVDYLDGPATRRGIARAINISAAHPKVRQTIRIETHE